VGDAKRIEVKPIATSDARRLVERVHYSGSTVQNSQIHLGVFIGGRLHGAMQFGPPLDRRKMLPIVRGATWESVIELNRMAFDEALPRNSESRALAVAFRMFKASAPQVKWIVSFADGCQCGDGTIYRASGFVLTGVKENGQIIEFPDGARMTAKSLTTVGFAARDEAARRYGAALGGGASLAPFLAVGAKPIFGYQFRYVRFLDPTWRDRLTVPVIPFDKIPDAARMYRGTRRPVGGTGDHPDAGGAGPTPALHTDEDGGR
jgi:hypothetical protein